MSNLDFDEYPIQEEEVIAILGNNYKVQGNELVFKCPACPGGDTNGDNLKFNRVEHILKCFACDFAEDVCEIISRRRYEKSNGKDEGKNYTFERKEQLEPVLKPERKKEIEFENLEEYYYDCFLKLISNKQLLRALYEKHTIMPKTVADCMIGYDDTKDRLVFPSRAVGKDPTDIFQTKNNGAEYREYRGGKNFTRIAGYDAKICVIHSSAFVMRGIICEGYKDGYNLVQLMKLTAPELLSHTAIFTVQNGSNSINTDSCLQKVNWNRFETIGVLMDNDEAGDKATDIALELFPRMKDLRGEYLFGENDVQTVFKKQFGSQIDIEKALEAKWLNEYTGVQND